MIATRHQQQHLRNERHERYRPHPLTWQTFSSFPSERFSSDDYDAAISGPDHEQKLVQLWRLCELVAFKAYIESPNLYDRHDLIADLYEKGQPILARPLHSGKSPAAYMHQVLAQQAKWLISHRIRKIQIETDFRRELAHATTLYKFPLEEVRGVNQLKREKYLRLAISVDFDEATQKDILRYLTPCLNKTVERIMKADDGVSKLSPQLTRLYAYLDSLQHVRRHFIGYYSSQNTPRVRYFPDKRVKRGTPEAAKISNRKRTAFAVPFVRDNGAR